MAGTQTARITLPGQAKPLKLQPEDLRKLLDRLYAREPASRLADEFGTTRATVSSYWDQRADIEVALGLVGLGKKEIATRENPGGD